MWRGHTFATTITLFQRSAYRDGFKTFWGHTKTIYYADICTGH